MGHRPRPPYDFRHIARDAPGVRHGLPDDSTLDLIPLTRLTGYHLNARRGNVPKIAASLARLGQYRSIVVNVGTLTGRPDEVLAGNHTTLAARSMNWTHIGVEWRDVDDQTAATIVAVDNKSNDDATYDDGALVELLAQIRDPVLADVSGFTDAERDALLAKAGAVPDFEPDEDQPTLDRLDPHTCPSCGYQWRNTARGPVDA